MPRLKCSRVACYAVAGLVRASILGAPGSSFVGLLAARGCKALPAPGCRLARTREKACTERRSSTNTKCYLSDT